MKVSVSTRAPRVGDFMTRAPVAIDVNSDLEDALKLMQDNVIRHLPVMDGDRLVGVVSDRDMATIQTLLPDAWARIGVAEAMTPGPFAVPPDACLAEVAAVMAQEKYGCVIVTDHEGTPIGVFTTIDALRVLSQT